MKRRSAETSARRKKSPAPGPVFVVAEPLWRKDAPALRLMRRAARLALAATSSCPGRTKPMKDCVATVLLTDARSLRALNRDFRGLDRSTNVLSFPAHRTADSAQYLGDIALAYEAVEKEARKQKKSFAAHAAHLAVHGVLHLLGYDHEKAADAAMMEGLETRLLAELGLADPYSAAPYTKRGKPA